MGGAYGPSVCLYFACGGLPYLLKFHVFVGRHTTLVHLGFYANKSGSNIKRVCFLQSGPGSLTIMFEYFNLHYISAKMDTLLNPLPPNVPDLEHQTPLLKP